MKDLIVFAVKADGTRKAVYIGDDGEQASQAREAACEALDKEGAGGVVHSGYFTASNSPYYSQPPSTEELLRRRVAELEKQLATPAAPATPAEVATTPAAPATVPATATPAEPGAPKKGK